MTTLGATKNNAYRDLPHVLVIDDDARISDLVSRYLTQNGFVVMLACTALEARKLLKHFVFDVVILDVMMPEESGLDFAKSMRQTAHRSLPILMLSALGEVEDRITGFEAGVDDYLPKPFEPKELVMRLQALLRRAKKASGQKSQAYTIGPWVLNVEAALLSASSEADKEVHLTDTELRLLCVLAARAGDVFSREELSTACEVEGGERAIDVLVTRLRRKLERDSRNPRYLQTVRGKGYLLRAEEVF